MTSHVSSACDNPAEGRAAAEARGDERPNTQSLPANQADPNASTTGQPRAGSHASPVGPTADSAAAPSPVFAQRNANAEPTSSADAGAQDAAPGTPATLAAKGLQEGACRELDLEDEYEEEASVSRQNRRTRVVEESPKRRFARFNELIGEGAFKRVYRAWDGNLGVEVAWNAVKFRTLEANAGAKRVIQEMKILQSLDHPNIIKFYASWLNKEAETVVFITELISSGTLKEFTESRPVRMCILKRWCKDVLKALRYLHGHSPPIIHRDLKPDNIFINGCSGDIRIGDLGMASWNRNSDRKQSVLGTPEYMAPELYDEDYDEQVDIYSFGMCVLEIVTGKSPYSECATAAQVFRKVSSGVPPNALALLVPGSPVEVFIRKCIDLPSPGQRRPSAIQLYGDEFLQPSDSDDKLCSEVLLQADSASCPASPLEAAASVSSTQTASSFGSPLLLPARAESLPPVAPLGASFASPDADALSVSRSESLPLPAPAAPCSNEALPDAEYFSDDGRATTTGEACSKADLELVSALRAAAGHSAPFGMHGRSDSPSSGSAGPVSDFRSLASSSEDCSLQNGADQRQLRGSPPSPVPTERASSHEPQGSERASDSDTDTNWVCSARPAASGQGLLEVDLTVHQPRNKVKICFQFDIYEDSAAETMQEMVKEGALPTGLPAEDLAAICAQLELFKTTFATPSQGRARRRSISNLSLASLSSLTSCASGTQAQSQAVAPAPQAAAQAGQPTQQPPAPIQGGSSQSSGMLGPERRASGGRPPLPSSASNSSIASAKSASLADMDKQRKKEEQESEIRDLEARILLESCEAPSAKVALNGGAPLQRASLHAGSQAAFMSSEDSSMPVVPPRASTPAALSSSSWIPAQVGPPRTLTPVPLTSASWNPPTPQPAFVPLPVSADDLKVSWPSHMQTCGTGHAVAAQKRHTISCYSSLSKGGTSS